MAMDFPSNPTDGQTYGSYVYNASKGVWQAKPTSATVAINSPTVPPTGNAGDIWFNTLDGTLYVYVVDVDGGQWVESQAPITANGYYSPNYIINGAFDIWQRGTSFSSNDNYTADRWRAYSAAGTYTVARSTDVPSSIAGTYSLEFAGTGLTNPRIFQRFEASNSTLFAGQTITLSVWAKSTVGTAGLAWATYYPSSADTWATASNATGSTSDQSGTFTAGMTVNSWTRYTATFTANANAVKGYHVEVFRPVTTTSVTTRFAGVQLEAGSTATPFRRNAPSIQGELAACQRYYYRVNASSTDTNYYRPTTGVASSTNGQFLFNFPVTMRVAPYSIDSSAIGTWKIFQNNSTYTGTSLLSLGQNGLNASTVAMNATGQTSGQFCILEAAASQAGYVGFSAEL